jgi:hypothetical protein
MGRIQMRKTNFLNHHFRFATRGRSIQTVESPGGISPPGAPRSVREPLDFPMLGRFQGTAANERRASDLCGEADQTSRVLLWF